MPRGALLVRLVGYHHQLELADVAEARDETPQVAGPPTMAFGYLRLTARPGGVPETNPALTVGLALTDTATVSDGLTLTVGKALTDQATPTDDTTRAVTKALADDATVTDQASVAGADQLALTDTATVSDDLTVSVPGELELDLADTATVTDDLTVTLGPTAPAGGGGGPVVLPRPVPRRRPVPPTPEVVPVAWTLDLADYAVPLDQIELEHDDRDQRDVEALALAPV